MVAEKITAVTTAAARSGRLGYDGAYVTAGWVRLLAAAVSLLLRRPGVAAVASLTPAR